MFCADIFLISPLASQTNNEGQNPMTRAMVAVELIQLSTNGIMEFKEAPAITAVSIRPTGSAEFDFSVAS